MAPLSFPLTPAVLVSSDYAEGFFTDHNRRELAIAYDEIGNVERTAAGMLRGYVIKRKRTFSLSWEMVPSDISLTVDGYWSGKEIQDFYDNTYGAFSVKFYHQDRAVNINNPLYSTVCRFKDFTISVVKRGATLSNGMQTDFCNFSLSLEEV